MTIEGQILYLIITFAFALFSYFAGKTKGFIVGLSAVLVYFVDQGLIEIVYGSDGEIEDIKVKKNANL